MKYLKLIPLLLVVALAGCGDPAPRPAPRPAPNPPQPVVIDVSDVVNRAVELKEERVHLVTIKMQKSSFTLDPWEHLSNAAKAEYRTILVGEKQYNDYTIGQKISSKFDGWGFLFDGDVASYNVTVYSKETQSEFFAVFPDGRQRKLSQAEYDRAREQLGTAGKHAHTVSAMGAIRTYVLDKPLAETTFTKVEPLKRYFVTIEVSNSTFTLDWTKHVRNLANKHEITLEVPRVVYDTSNQAWEPKPSWGTLFLSGRLSTIRGKILKKWEENDSQYDLATTADGRTIVIPRSR